MDLNKWDRKLQLDANNEYFMFPKDEAEFKQAVFMDNKKKGLIIRIFTNNNEFLLDRIVNSTQDSWSGNVTPQGFISTTSIDGEKIRHKYRNCKIYAVPKGYENMLPPKVTKTDFDNDKFLSLIKEFMDKVDELRKINSIKGTGKDEWNVIKSMENLLQNIGYEPHFSFGSGKLISGKGDKICGIAFCRSNTIGDEFVNQKNLVSTGVYIWLGYADQEIQPYLKLVIGCGEYTKECIAIDTIEKHHNNGEWEFSYNSDYFEAQKEQIAKDFLYLVKEFDSIPLEHFKPKGGTMENQTKIPPLNQILYGPPGTGKTYSTIDKALDILRHYKVIDEIPESREDKRAIFDEYRANKQIEFVTFHQSFSYEEFVEGIKPKFVKKSKNPSNETEKKSKKMIYKVKSGIFKKICKKALKNCDSSNKIILQKIQERIKSNPCVWKVSLGEKTSGEALLVQKYCFKHNEIRIAHLDKGDGDRVVKPFKDTMQKGDFVGVFSEKSILKAIGIIVGDYEEKEVIGDSFQKIAPFKRTRKVKWLLKNEYIDSGKNLSNPQDAVFDSKIKAKDLFEKIQDRVGYTFDDLPNQITCKDLPKKPYILIIYEINRGNISKILGELITLIEPSKRIGASEELRITLPYSGNEFDNGNGFGVPSNLYIIGTMNTADRSIALLDTALRRRFEFVEMMPNCKELQKIWLVNKIGKKDSSIESWEGEKGEDGYYYSRVLFQMLTAINNRIEFLLDREHTVGHAFFFEKAQFYKTIYDENNLREWEQGEWYELSLDSLKEIFAKKIIPLLQEYFYDDYAKIDAVLNNNGMVKAKSMSDLGVNLSDDFVDSEKRIYHITDSSAWNAETFTKIYE